MAVIQKDLDGGLEQAESSVVTMQPHIFVQALDAGKDGVIAAAGKQFNGGAFPHLDGGLKSPETSRDGFAEVAVGRITDKPGAREQLVRMIMRENQRIET